VKQKHHTAEQIVGMLRQAEAKLAQGQVVKSAEKGARRGRL